MRTTGVRFEWAGGVARLDAGGDLSVGPAGHPAEEFLTMSRPVAAGAGLVGGTVQADADETELVLTGGDLSVTTRHSFVAGWQTRWVVANTSERRIWVGELRLPARVAPGCAGRAVAARAEAALFVHPDRGPGPVLVGRLRRGEVMRIDADGLLLLDLDLAPGARVVVTWDWDWYPTPAAYARSRPLAVPGSTVAFARAPVIVPASLDVALVAPPGLTVTDEGTCYELTADAPGTHRVELRSARGLTALDLTWVPCVADVLRAAAVSALAAADRRAGVRRLHQVTQALLVQAALRAGALDSDTAEEAGDALDQFTARFALSPAAEPGEEVQRAAEPAERVQLAAEPAEKVAAIQLAAEPAEKVAAIQLAAEPAEKVAAIQLAAEPGPELAAIQLAAEPGPELAAIQLAAEPAEAVAAIQLAAYLAGEHERTGEAEPLEAATALVLATARRQPGLGLAATRVLLGRLVSGRSITEIAGHLGALAEVAGRDQSADSGLLSGGERLDPDALARAELLLVTSGPPGTLRPSRAPVEALIRQLGWTLGAGLPGTALTPPATEDLAHLLTVLSLVPEDLGETVRGEWGRSVAELVGQALPVLVARLAGQPAGPAHAWLALRAGMTG